MKHKLILFSAAAVLLFCSFGKKRSGPVAIAFSHYCDSIHVGDTIVIPYNLQPLNELQDTMLKYLNGHGADVKLLMFSQATYVIDSLDLSVVPNVEVMEFCGDVDILEDRKYKWMNLEKLRLIRCWSVFLPNATLENSRQEKRDVINVIHKYRPDVKVKFPRKEPAAILTDRCDGY